MRPTLLLIVALLASMLAACGGGGDDFEADFAAAKATVATLEGGAFDHAVGQRMQVPEITDATAKCATENASDRTAYRGVMEFEDGGGYEVRFEVDDDLARCVAQAYEGRQLPEPPSRPYLIPVEIGATAK